MFPTFISILDIQSWWEVPSIAHFCSLFRTAFNLLDFDIEDLEEALLTDGTEESSWLQELIVRLLSGCLPNNEISTFNYQMFLRRLFRQKCQEHDQYNPFNTDIDFQLLPLRTKVDILHALCDFRLDADDVLDQLKNLEADSLRVEPLGYDSNESAYWYFYGTRLYREDYTTKNNKKKAVWQVICFTEDDWFQLTKKLKKSSNKAERQLHLTLNENFLPELPRLFKEKENLARKRLLENVPRRTSSRLKKLENESEKDFQERETCKEKLKKELEIETKKKKRELEKDIEIETKKKKRELENRRQEAYERRTKLKEKSEDEILEEEEEEEEDESNEEMASTRSKKYKTKEKTSVKDEKKKSNKKRDKHNESGKNVSSSKPTMVGRQTNNSLSAATGQILIEPVKNTNKKKLKTSQVFRQTDEDLQTGMHKILDFVKNHEDAWPFNDPVEEEYAPNYYSIIRKPMDLQRMEERLDSGYYKTFDKFRADFQLIVDNCKLYNGAENEYTEMVDNLVTEFKKATEKYLDQISSSDDEIAIEFTLEDKIKNKTKKLEESTTNSRRKPMLVAQTDRKRQRSDSEESLQSLRSDSLDSPPITRSAKQEEPKKSKKEEPKKQKMHEKKSRIEKEENKSKIEKEEKKPKTEKEEKRHKIEKEDKKLKIEKEEKKHKIEKEEKKLKIEKEEKKHKIEKEEKKLKIEKDEKKTKIEREERRAKIEKEEKKLKVEKEKKSLKVKSKKGGKKEKEKEKKKKVKNKVVSRSPSSSPPPSSPDSRFSYLPNSWGGDTKEDFSDFESSSKEGKRQSQDPELFENLSDHDHHFDKKIKKDDPTSPSPKPKDKHNKLRETIEKLKAKSEIKLKNESFEFEVEQSKENKEKPKEDKSKKKEKKPEKIEMEAETPIVMENSKTTSNMDALSIATEQTLKDINKWLDDTPKFAEFSSASNSPSYTGLDELDTITNKIDQIPGKKIDKPLTTKKEPNKDPKKKPFRDPSKFFKRREVQRTIDRLQPGKSKGNLITNVQNTNKTDEIFPLGPLSKLKDTKNSLIVKTNTNAPKLSLGSVLDSFGKHKFVDDQKKEQKPLEEVKIEDKPAVKEVENPPTKPEQEIEKSSQETTPTEDGATPNLSAWFKAFGAPKIPPVAKKNEPKVEDKTEDNKKITLPLISPNSDQPPTIRQRRISTGSSVSERSSFSQDMDSPRVGMDERGAYPAPYPSPLHRSPSGASPVMASPRPDISPKATYSTINGQIRVGFYQDTVSNKSSPDKSCSPKENTQTTAYYSEHVYTPNTTAETAYYSYTNPPYYTHVPNYSSTNPTPPYNTEGNYSYYGSTKSQTQNYTANSPASNQPSPLSPVINSPIIYSPHSPTVLPQHSPSINSPRPLSTLCSNSPEVELQEESIKNDKLSSQGAVFPVKKRAYNENELPHQKFEIDPRLTQQIEFKKNLEAPKEKTYVHQNIPDPKNLNLQGQDEFVYNVESNYPLNIPARDRNVGSKIDMSKYTNMGYTGPDISTRSFSTSVTAEKQVTTAPKVSSMANLYPNPNLALQQPHGNFGATTTENIDRFGATIATTRIENPDRFGATTITESINDRFAATRTEKIERFATTIAATRTVNTDRFGTTVAATRIDSIGDRFGAPTSDRFTPTVTATRTENITDRFAATRTENIDRFGTSVTASRSDNISDRFAASVVATNDRFAATVAATRTESINDRFAATRTENIDRFAATITENIDRFASTVTATRTESINDRISQMQNVSSARSNYGSTSAEVGRNMANLSHIVDRFSNEERMMSSFYGDKGLGSAHILNKPISTFSQANMTAAIQSYSQSPSLYNRQIGDLQSQGMIQNEMKSGQQMVQEKKSKKRKSSKIVPASSSETQQQQQQSAATAAVQGFQSYAGLKSTPSTLEPSAISLKTSSVVPGSAFNFGPTPAGLGLDGYSNFLEEFRSTPNFQSRPAHQNSNPQSYPFLGAPQARSTYPIGGPFIPNAAQAAQLMDTGSPLYQHYLQAGVLNQGLLPPPPGAYPPGYHPALSMRQPYDSMNRPPWL